MTRSLLGVAGFPVGHSRSPAIQNAALRELGLQDWLYVPVPLPPERFVQTVHALPASGFRGLNVTVPHKVAAHDLADARSAAVEAIGAANTLTFSDGRIEAENTDAGGFLDALGEDPRGQEALVLGAGGSARAVVWALLEAGADVSVWNRTRERAREMAAALGARHAERPAGVDLLVNCTSVGLDAATTTHQAADALGLAGGDRPRTAVDLVYGASPTPFLRWAREGGARVVEGIEVLVCQGARSLAIWTGCAPPIEAMSAAARGAGLPPNGDDAA
jgi:shikimate dehydrogenase